VIVSILGGMHLIHASDPPQGNVLEKEKHSGLGQLILRDAAAQLSHQEFTQVDTTTSPSAD